MSSTATTSEGEDFITQIADSVESFLIAVRAIAAEGDGGSAVPLLLLEVSQVLLTGARLGAHQDFEPREQYQPDVGEEADVECSAQHVRDAGRRALLLPCDLAQAEDCAAIVDRTFASFGRLDVVVNNAAYQGAAVKHMEEIDADRIRRTFATNIESMFHIVRAALPHMRPGASIINTASIQAYDPSGNILDYAATKGAIVAFTKGLAGDLAERGMRCNAVAPGPVWTPLIAQSFGGKQLANFGASNPMGRPAQPAELAPAYVFLACDESRFVNGEILGVTGGGLLA